VIFGVDAGSLLPLEETGMVLGIQRASGQNKCFFVSTQETKKRSPQL